MTDTDDSHALQTILALRDTETGKTLELRALAEGEVGDIGALFAAKRKTNPPPRFDLMLGVAESVDAFVLNFPRFARGQAGGGDGSAQAEPAREVPDDRAPAAHHGSGKD